MRLGRLTLALVHAARGFDRVRPVDFVGREVAELVVQADEQYRRDRSYLPQFSVASSTGGTVPLDRVVKLTEGLSPSSISRLNRLRQVTVSASLPPNSSESDAVAKIQQL